MWKTNKIIWHTKSNIFLSQIYWNFNIQIYWQFVNTLFSLDVCRDKIQLPLKLCNKVHHEQTKIWFNNSVLQTGIRFKPLFNRTPNLSFLENWKLRWPNDLSSVQFTKKLFVDVAILTKHYYQSIPLTLCIKYC